MGREVDPELAEALGDLRAYLSDRVAPLLVAQALELLFDHPEALSSELVQWVGERSRVGGVPARPAADHALAKLRALEQFELLPRARFAAVLARIEMDLLAAAPEPEAAGASAAVEAAAEPAAAGVALAAAAPAAPLQPSAPPPPPPPAEPQLSPEEVARLDAFERLMERALAWHGKAAFGDGTSEVARALSVLGVAAASSAADLEARYELLQKAGAAPAVIRELVDSLAAAVPDRAVGAGSGIELARGPSHVAVEKAIEHAGDEARLVDRWKSLQRAAIDAFNAGASRRAAALFALLGEFVRAGRVDPYIADRALARAHDQLEVGAVLAAVGDPRRSAALASFAPLLPGFRIESILDELASEPDRRRRRALLAVAELVGAGARERVIERLRESLSGTAEQVDPWWYQRNLAYLLHRLPRPEGADGRAELELGRALTDPRQHPAVQREAYTLLGKLPRGQGAVLLVQRLEELERSVDAGALLGHDRLEVQRSFDALAAALARSGSIAARHALLAHALADKQRGGDAMARLEEFAETDLGRDVESVTRLLKALAALQSVKIFGIEVASRDARRAHVVRALGATRHPEVERALAGVPGAQALRAAGARRAAEAATEFDEPAPRPGAAPRGRDLELADLVDLVADRAAAGATVRLVVEEQERESAALDFAGGRLVAARALGLQGAAALHQLLETFSAGRHRVESPTGDPPDELAARPATEHLVEGLRRREEYDLLRVAVPDDLFVRSTGSRPTVRPGEGDVEFVKRLWQLAGRGATAAACEIELAVEPLRVRALLAHWLDEGALDGRREPAPG
jgi:hypothetical protein